ncbi:MAG: RNA polymerase sigma factor, partial [Phaeodactylibacter sp.]|nr:RNA polymerase sigma factor [Phaeodactylibacter sp.]
MTTAEFSNQFDQLSPKMFGFALKLTQNQEKAKDLMQETALKAYRHREKFKSGTNFRAWVSTIMRNTFINDYRRNKKRQVVNEPIEDFAFALESTTITPNQGEMNLRMEELHGLLDGLSDLYRVPFLMHFRGYEYKEIAAHLDIPIG